MRADTNPAGDIFGGWLMAQMDTAAGNMASRVSRGRSATVAVEAMSYLRLVKVGDEVTLYAELQSTGHCQNKPPCVMSIANVAFKSCLILYSSAISKPVLRSSNSQLCCVGGSQLIGTAFGTTLPD